MLDLYAYGTAFTAAVVVGFMRDVCRRKNLNPKQEGGADGGKNPPCLLSCAVPPGDGRSYGKPAMFAYRRAVMAVGE